MYGISYEPGLLIETDVPDLELALYLLYHVGCGRMSQG